MTCGSTAFAQDVALPAEISPYKIGDILPDGSTYVDEVSLIKTIEKFQRDRRSKERELFSVLDSNAGFFGSGLLLEGGTAGTKINAVATYHPPRGSFDNTAISLSLETALDKDAERTDFVTNFDLNGDITGKLSINRAFSTFQSTDEDAEALSLVANAIWHAGLKCRAVVPAAEHKAKCSRKDRKYWLDPNNHHLSNASDRQVILDYTKLESDFKDSSYYFIGAEAALGRDKQSYRSSMDFSKTDDNKTPRGLSGYIGLVPKIAGDGLRTYVVGVTHEIEYEALDARTLCRPATTTDPIECFSASYGEPKRIESNSIYGLTRFQKSFGPEGFSIPIGVEFKLAYDLKNKDFGFEIPIYFAPDKKGNLVSGIRLRYDEGGDSDNNDDFSIGFFVGQKFDLFGGG